MKKKVCIALTLCMLMACIAVPGIGSEGTETPDAEETVVIGGENAQTFSTPEVEPEEEPEETEEEEENLDPDAGKSQQQVFDELTGQLSLFPDDEN